MWPARGKLINLKDVLRIAGNNDWQWRINDLDGLGPLPNGMSWDEFDEKIESAPYVLDWPGILEFAAPLVQVKDGEIVAVSEGKEMARIEAFDSGEWKVSLSEVNPEQLDERISRLLEDAL